MRPPKSIGLRILRRVLIWLILLFSAALVARWTGVADRVFFHPGRDTPPPPLGAEEVWFTNGAGQKLHAWLLKPAGVSKPPVVLHCHGNAGTIDDHLGFSDFLVDDGFAVFIFDYRGYGRSDDHAISRRSIIEDAAAALDLLLSRADLDASRLAVLGVSLGSVPASHLAAERQEVRALVLVSPFSSWSGVASDHLPVAGTILVRTGSDPATAIRALGARPLKLIHGDRDTIVRPRHSDRLLEVATAAGVRASLETVAGAGHNDIMESAPARNAVSAFIAEALGTP